MSEAKQWHGIHHITANIGSDVAGQREVLGNGSWSSCRASCENCSTWTLDHWNRWDGLGQALPWAVQ